MTHVVFLNGPPRCGKDTAGEILRQAVPGARVVKFAHALKVATHALMLGLRGELKPMNEQTGEAEGSPESLNAPYNDAYFESEKGKELPEFFGITPRAAYIAVSELLCKPLFGPEFFGTVLLRSMVLSAAESNPVPLWVITDHGFEPEANPIIKAVGRENCTLVRIHREGCDFAKDSRTYVHTDVPNKFDLMNNGTVEEFAYLLRTTVLGRIE